MERYCKGKQAYFEGDNQCYYHGEEMVCPLCGKKTVPVMQGEYMPPKPDHDVYTLREIGG